METYLDRMQYDMEVDLRLYETEAKAIELKEVIEHVIEVLKKH